MRHSLVERMRHSWMERMRHSWMERMRHSWMECMRHSLAVGSLVAAAAWHALPASAQQVPQPAPDPVFTVNAFAVEGDNPLSEARTQAVLAPYTGTVNLDRLQEAVGALESELKDQGFAFLRV